jgi:energy-coupling factor transport system ATP-binding protein
VGVEATEPDEVVNNSSGRTSGTGESIVELRDIGFRYPGARRDSLEGASLTIQAGAFVAVVGANGSGKTTLCKTINGLVPHFFQGEFEGTATVAGLDMLEAGVAGLARHVGYVSQDFDNQLVRATVRDEARFAPLNFGLPDWRQRGDEALEAVGITHLADEMVWQLSGGQRHLVAIAASLSLGAEILIIDEPVAQLDPRAALATYERLSELNNQGRTIIVIEHHTELVAEHCTSVALVVDGAVRWHLPTREALGRVHELSEQSIHPPAVARMAVDLGVEPPVPITVDEAARRLSDWIRVAPVAETASEPPTGAQPIATWQTVSHAYRRVEGGRVAVLEGVDLTVRSGERVALVGGNGSGKSTLMRLLSGHIRPTGGVVTVGGIDTADQRPDQLADLVMLVPQRPEEVFLLDSIRADALLHPEARRRPDAAEVVDAALRRLDLHDLADRDGRMLSGGQQRRAALAIALSASPRVLLLDEPTASLDVASRLEIVEAVAVASAGVEAVMIATHDMELVARWATRAVVLSGGVIVDDGTPHEVFDRTMAEQSGVLPPPPVLLSRRLGITPPALTPDALARRLRPATAEAAS